MSESSKAGHTRAELASVDPNATPERGDWCDHCQTFIPVFLELRDADRARVLQLAFGGRGVLAVQELMAFVGCPESWATLWVSHEGKGKAVFPGPPCPQCGELLVSSRARQCSRCGADWHA